MHQSRTCGAYFSGTITSSGLVILFVRRIKSAIVFRDTHNLKPLAIRDAMLVTAIAALHLAITKFAVDFRDSCVSLVVLLAPTALTLLLHHRLQLRWQFAAILHYFTSLVWAFAYGITFSLFWNRIPHTFYEKNSVGLATPILYGRFCVEVMAIFGIATSFVYAIAAYKLSPEAKAIDRRTMR
ncbi:MAG: hypothetical protein R3C03_01965 [Pirellulaceae bacterium]